MTPTPTLRALRRALLGLAVLLPAVPGFAEDGTPMTLQRYVRLLPETLKTDMPAVLDRSRISDEKTSLDPDDALNFCAGQQQSALLAPDPESSDEGAESIKKKLRDLWQKLGYRLYTHYKLKEQAEGSLRGLQETADEAEVKVPAALASLREFAAAVDAFHQALAGGHRKDIKAKAKKITDKFAAAEAACRALVGYHEFPKILVDDKRTANDFTPGLAKCREGWDTLPAELAQFPGVKEFVAARKTELESLETEYAAAYKAVLEACRKCIGSEPAIYAEAGLEVTRYDGVPTYLRAKNREAEAKK